MKHLHDHPGAAARTSNAYVESDTGQTKTCKVHRKACLVIDIPQIMAEDLHAVDQGRPNTVNGLSSGAPSTGPERRKITRGLSARPAVQCARGNAGRRRRDLDDNHKGRKRQIARRRRAEMTRGDVTKEVEGNPCCFI
jgi:hypothetical protein